MLLAMTDDSEFMHMAFTEARAAAQAGEVPVGAVLVLDGKVMARGRNSTIGAQDPTAHAEILALREGARVIGNYRLLNTTLYVTLEPCAMCAGALVHARVSRLVYGCDDPKVGAVHGTLRMLDHPMLNHRVEVTSGVLAEECASLLQEFFASRR
jgi:tRNA(adenine34) deaminase